MESRPARGYYEVVKKETVRLSFQSLQRAYNLEAKCTLMIGVHIHG